MPDFSKAKIYKLVSNKSSDVYIGSCIIELSKRLSNHKSKSNECVSKSMFINDAIISIVLIEDYPCENKNQLKARELHYITTLQCINKNKPYISDILIGDEWYKQYYIDNKEQKKQYRLEHLEHIKQRTMQYRLDHAEEIKQQEKQYRLEHLEHIKQRKAQYYAAHKEQIKANNQAYHETHKEEIKAYHQAYIESHNVIINCECGSSITSNNKTKHDTTKKHLNYIQQTLTANNETLPIIELAELLII